MIRNTKGQIQVMKPWHHYDAHFAYIMLVANRSEIEAMFRENFRRR